MQEYSKLDSTKTALEIGPGTGQATEPILKTGCSYLAIELGENLAEFMSNKYKSYDNFRLINDDFETYNFGYNKFNLVYSGATFQWIKEVIGYPKLQDILKSGGTYAYFATLSENADKSLNSGLIMTVSEAEQMLGVNNLTSEKSASDMLVYRPLLSKNGNIARVDLWYADFINYVKPVIFFVILLGSLCKSNTFSPPKYKYTDTPKWCVHAILNEYTLPL